MAIVASLLLAGLLVAASVMTFDSTREEAIAKAQEAATRQVLTETSALKLATLSVVRGERGYLLTQDELFLEPYLEGRINALKTVNRIEQLVADYPAQAARQPLLRANVREYLESSAIVINLMREGSGEAAVDRVRSGLGRNAIEEIMGQIDLLEEEAHAILEQRMQRADAAALRTHRFIELLGLVGLLLLAVGSVFAMALRRSLEREAAAFDKIRRFAETDELTGLSNRRELLRSLDRMIGASKRSSRPLSIAILDIDRFKRVNDTYGHPAGDEVIKAVGQVATQMMRDQDVIGRLGGEEFVIIFPDCDTDAALAACERLRSAIAGLPVLIEDGAAITVTLSFGVSRFGKGDDRTSLIARADEALYEAKEGGRDQVRLAA
ncbi:GGDEF domain-containing protein [Aurantiacibacter marinus]|uniref:GGDEF domain-containing protein n=1 Tax=Aurantiacibacter marinus TaxID=874156 RepID=UPI000699935D|nr:diguanylate cyclase [Aurantiacibacter marinus]